MVLLVVAAFSREEESLEDFYLNFLNFEIEKLQMVRHGPKERAVSPLRLDGTIVNWKK